MENPVFFNNMLQKSVTEEKITAKELLASKGLDPNLYFVSVNGEHVKADEMIGANQEATIIPIVKGGSL